MPTMRVRQVELDFAWAKDAESIASAVLWATLWMLQEDGIEPMKMQARLAFAMKAVKATIKMMQFVEQLILAHEADDDE